MKLNSKYFDLIRVGAKRTTDEDKKGKSAALPVEGL